MKRTDTPPSAAILRAALAAALLAGCPLAASAQPAQAPGTEAGSAVAAPGQVGDVTRRLLTAQANGSIAGPQLPMLGAAATIAYQRYLDSFSHKIPEFFETRVQSQSNRGTASR